MSTHYIDTSTLKWRYLSGLPTVTVNQLMDNPEHRVFTSELTLLEWSNALASECREGRIDYETYKINELAFMRDIADGRLEIFPMTRSIERARYLIEYVGVIKGRGLRTGDSIQLLTALDVVTAMREAVIFVTSDEKLAKIIQDLDTFNSFLTALFLPR